MFDASQLISHSVIQVFLTSRKVGL